MKFIFLCLFLTSFHVAFASKIIGVTMDYRENADNANQFAFGSFYGIRQNYVTSLQKACKKYDVTVILTPIDISMVDKYSQIVDGLMVIGNFYDVNPDLYGEKVLNASVNVDKFRNKFEFAMIKKMMSQKKPVLGICGGYQSLNVSNGGTLYQDLATQVTPSLKHKIGGDVFAHTVEVSAGTKLAKILEKSGSKLGDKIFVNSAHHQSVKKVANGFVASAFAPDGVVEAIESTEYPFALGVQWHPEFELSKFDTAILDSLCEAVSLSK